MVQGQIVKASAICQKGLDVWTDLSRTLKIFGAKVLKGFLKPFKKIWLISVLNTKTTKR